MQKALIVVSALTLGLILMLTYDTFQLCSRYLYLSFEIGVLLLSLMAYFPAFNHVRWNDPPEKSDTVPQPDWKKFSLLMGVAFGGLTAILTIIWAAKGIVNSESLAQWMRGGSWFLYYGGIFILSVIIIGRHMQHVHASALICTTIIQTLILTAFEIILLGRGQGWAYDGTVLGFLMGIPLENIIFIYPVSPALSIVFYSIISKNMNDLKAFWLINAILLPCSIIVEWVGIYPLRLWHPFNQYSILPMDRTNIEEFIYYALFQFSAIIVYMFFARYLSRPRAQGQTRAA